MTVAYYPLLILLAPLTAALAIGFLEGTIGRKVYQIGTAAQVAALAISFWVLYQVGAGTEPIHVPLSAEGGLFQFGLYIDRLAAVMMTLISAIGLLIFLFSIRYMEQERGRTRFHALLNLTTFTLLCMVSSRNLLMLFIFWQLISWMLYLLVHNYSHPASVQGAAKTYTVLRIGDVAFLAGVVLAYRTYGTLEFPQLFIKAAQTLETFSLGGLSIGAPTVITLLIFIGAMSKSVQFPMHIWLPGNLYAPTPVTALLHAGIINAGGFLMNRLAPLYGLSPATLHFALAIGLLTTLLGATMMLTQNDIKKTLAHSTIGQMGYMIMECGLGGFALAIFHLIAHGLFKATVFLDSGHVIHAARREPRHPPLHGPKVDATAAEGDFSRLTWGAGFVMTLILPLVLVLAAHGALQIPFLDSQGMVIFLFFSWVTSSQAILTLYRLRAVSSWKVASMMMVTLLLVVLTYLFAAEHLTEFLYPAPGEAAAYFQAAALHGWLFDFLVGATALLIIFGWIVIYARSHGFSIRMPERANALMAHLYVLFMNRLYLEAFYARLGRRFKGWTRRLDRSAPFRIAFGLIAFAFVLGRLLPVAAWLGNLSAGSLAMWVVAALLLPLFPLHGLYVAALTRLPGVIPMLLAILLPLSGFYAINGALSEMPVEIRGAVSLLALFGALYGALKALAQFRVERLIAYAGVALFSTLWWYLAGAGNDAPQGAIYAGAVALITGGLFFAWSAVQARYGDLDLDRIGGLARPMPRFALLLSLLVTAAMGLPPFGLFSGLMQMLMNRSVPISWDLAVIALTWLAASCFFLNLMQRLLFGPHRTDIQHTDLRSGEAAPLAIVLVILLVIGIAPDRFIEPATPPNEPSPSAQSAREGEAPSAKLVEGATQAPMNRPQRANASVEGEAHAASPHEGATQAPLIKASLWK
jgi:NADH-quinone oxidoreductase subunit L